MMKKPERHGLREGCELQAEDLSVEGHCRECFEEWPCPTWGKWLRSKDYKIDLLRQEVETLKNRASRQGDEISSLREKVHRNDLLIRGALLPFVNDLANGVNDGRVEASTTVDTQDFTSGTLGAKIRVAGLREFHVTYTSSRQIVEDGDLTEYRAPRAPW